MTGTKALSFAELPILVRFRDINDPTSVERVDPDNLAASFGPGVTLVNASIEIVSSGFWPFRALGLSGTPVTTGIEKRLVGLPALSRVLNFGRG